MRWRRVLAVALAVAAALATSRSGTSSEQAASAPAIRFGVFVRTGLRLGDIVWTGNAFLYVTQNSGEIHTSAPDGSGLRKLAQVAPEVEEMRCLPSPGAHGFPADAVFCHAPRNTIYRIGADGQVATFARLPVDDLSDGGLAFDTDGAFGYRMLAATGGSTTNGGAVYAVDAAGRAKLIGRYPGPGGADNLLMAPRGWGSAGGRLLIAIDHTRNKGMLQAMAPNGTVRVLARFPGGLNPVVAVRQPLRAARAGVRPGLYITETFSGTVFFAAAAQLRRYTGNVIVGSEIKGWFWVVRPDGRRYRATRLRTNLHAAPVYNLEGAKFVAG
jgi:hypothetical protein